MDKYEYSFIKKICKEKKVKCTVFTENNTYIIVFEKDKKRRYFRLNRFDLNLHGIGEIVDNKYWCYTILNHFNLPMVEHNYIAKQEITNDLLKSVEELYEKYNHDIVIKPNDGAAGFGVHRVYDKNYIKPCLEKVFDIDNSISVSPYLDIDTEYRVYILNGEPIYIYGKVKPIVIGDGKKTFIELLREFNEPFFKDHFHNNDYEMDYIPKAGEKVVYNWRFNLSQGAQVKEISDMKLKKRIENLSRKIAEKLNLKFVTIDIANTFDGKLTVIEINSGVSVRIFMTLNKEKGYEIAKDIYSRAIDEMFKM